MTVHKPKLVSLLANWYSGATLFTILLDRHTEIVSNGESMLFDDKDERRYICSCGKYIDECDFYRTTASHMRRSNGAGWDKELFVHVPVFSRKPVLRSLLRSWRYDSNLRHQIISLIPHYRNRRDRFLDAQLRFFANARKLTGASIYLDGTKSIRRAQLFSRDGRCETKALHLIRDGRGFCTSFLREEASRPTIRDAAKAWLRYIAQVDEFKTDFPSVPVLSVRYEDLCRSTSETIRTVCQFLEIPFEELTARSMQGAHILGNEMRRHFDGTIVENTSWKEKLSHDAQNELLRLLKPQLQRFGYV